MLDRLTLDQLRVLVAVAETGSFSAAARRLGRVQSAISQTVNALESVLGTPLFERDGKVPQLNDAGRVILADARHLIAGVDALKARAESITEEVEPELTLAVDAIFPHHVLVQSLKALSEQFSCMPVTLFTEALGAGEQRIRDGVARLGILSPVPNAETPLESEFLIDIPTIPVVAASHPLAAEAAPLTRATLAQHVQLVLTDRSPMTSGIQAGILSTRTWRFVDQQTRHEFLVGGFGWCNMPYHMVREDLDTGRLKRLDVPGLAGRSIPLHVVHQRGWTPGKAGRWLIDDIRRRMGQCVGAGVLTVPETPTQLDVAQFDFAD
jgi:DNA-binding transcriptional LysR family regulator